MTPNIICVLSSCSKVNLCTCTTLHLDMRRLLSYDVRSLLSICLPLQHMTCICPGEPEAEQYVQAPIQKEKFYTEGSPALKAARLQVFVCSLFRKVKFSGNFVPACP